MHSNRCMALKYSKTNLKKLEEIFIASDFKVRYEKGHFQSGYCVLHDKKIIVVNKFFKLKGRIDSFLDILNFIGLSHDALSKEQIDFLSLISKKEQEQVKLAS